MKLQTFFFLVLFSCLVSCSDDKSDYVKELILKDLDELFVDNAKLLTIIEAEVEKKSRREVDVEILEKAERLWAGRKYYGIPATIESELEVHKLQNIHQYLNYLDSLRVADNYSLKNEFIDNTRNAIMNFTSNSTNAKKDKNAARALLFLSYLEREFFELLAREVGGGCWFGIDFNYHISTDSARIGEHFDMVIAPEINPGRLLDLVHINTSLTIDGDTLSDYQFESVSGAVYFNFKPRMEGEYFLYSELLFEEFDYLYKDRIRRKIKVY